jgi:hypothetical protein
MFDKQGFCKVHLDFFVEIEGNGQAAEKSQFNFV